MDPFSGEPHKLGNPARRAVAIAPSDTAEFDPEPQGLYVGGAGDLSMLGPDDTGPVLWKGVPAGTVLPFRTRKLRATGTTATNILALY